MKDGKFDLLNSVQAMSAIVCCLCFTMLREPYWLAFSGLVYIEAALWRLKP